MNWLTRKPQSKAGVELRQLVKQIHCIRDRKQWGYWVVSLINWYKVYKDFVNQKSPYQDTGRYWYTHKSVRKAFIHIKRALPDMFHYLDNVDIPKSTNALESFFGHHNATSSMFYLIYRIVLKAF